MGTREFKGRLSKLLEENKLEYLDVAVYKNGKAVGRFLGGDAKGSELLQMYSMSKIFTVVCALRLIERGLLRLEDKVGDFYPDFNRAFYLKDGEPRRTETDVTVWHLLTMTSGLTYELETPEIIAVREALGDAATVHDFIPAFAKAPLAFEPGTDFEYGLSHDVLLGIVEKVSGVPFCEQVKNEIFDPLGMSSASFTPDTVGVYKKFECLEDGRVVDADSSNVFLLSKGYISGGAGLKCTVSDYSKLVIALTNGGIAPNGYRVLEESTLNMLMHKELDNSFVKRSFFWQGEDYGYGLGVRVRERECDFGLPIGEFGWDGACGQFWLSDRENGVSIVVGMNVLAWELKYMGIHSDIVRAVYETLEVKNA
jgi:CubicO group peptidase (beta-lactamase class C family)